MAQKIKKTLLILSTILIFIIGCTPQASQEGSNYKYASGSKGVIMNFLSGTPPSEIYSEYPHSEIVIPISIEIRNQGNYPTPEDNREGVTNLWKTSNHDDLIYISGYDPGLFSSTSWKEGEKQADLINSVYPVIKFEDRLNNLEGKSIYNPNGGYDLIELTATADLKKIKSEKYSPNFLVTLCYDYKTKATSDVCIDPRPFSTAKEEKVCSISDKTLNDQGAPVAVTKIEQKAISNSMQFKIHFRNVGGGDLIALDLTSLCSGQEIDGRKELKNNDLNLVKVLDVKIGEKSIKDNCNQLIKVGDYERYARLINNEGFIVCTLKDYKADVASAYITPIYVEFGYGYRDTISKTVDIILVPGSG